MANILPDNEVIEFEDRTYTNPQVSLDEGLAFIDNLRNIQNQNNAEIATDTYNLGTSIPSNLGGLGGGESYFTSRYQVPQGVALANNLRATAQAQALNDILQNEQAMMKQRYTNAQRAARQRAAARSNYGGGSGDPTTVPSGDGDVTVTPTNLQGKGRFVADQNDIRRGGTYMQSLDTNRYGGHDIIWIAPNGKQITIPQLSDRTYATADPVEFVKKYGGGNMPFIRSK